VCRLCTFFDTSKANECREPVAERVVNKTRANFCGYLTPRPKAYAANDAATSSARSGLESLFGLVDGTTSGSPDRADAARSALDALFRKARDQCRLDGFTFHDSRATALTLLSRRVDILTLQRISGHRNLSELTTYYRESSASIALRL
jgi:integrase